MPREVEFEPVPARTWQRPFGDLDRQANDLLALVCGQRRAFAGRADGDQAVHAVGDLTFDQRSNAAASISPSRNGVTSAV